MSKQLEGRIKPYHIGQGTGTVAYFDTFEEMCDFHSKMDSLNRHFCRLYDRNKHLTAEGWNVLWKYNDESRWTKW